MHYLLDLYKTLNLIKPHWWTISYKTRFHQYLANGSIVFQKNNTIETALMRPFLKLKNQCRNKEMASYFEKMTFYRNQQINYCRIDSNLIENYQIRPLVGRRLKAFWPADRPDWFTPIIVFKGTRDWWSGNMFERKHP